jgi:steroid delta-isomerase-like uncharacterized protein
VAETETETAARGTEETVRAYFDAIKVRDLEAMGAVWAPEGVDHLYGFAEMTGPDGVREYFGQIFAAFPDFELEVTDLITEDDRSCVRWRATGTFSGEAKFQGLNPNGASIVLEGMDLLTVRDGLIVDNRAYTDSTEVARQLGAMPPPGSVGEKAMIGAVNAGNSAKRIVQRLRDR